MILVCGGADYIGSHANKRLHARGVAAVVFDNLSRGRRSLARWGHFVHGDLADPERLRACFDRYPIAAAMHFAAWCYVGESIAHPSQHYHANVANTLNLLEAMREHGVGQIVFFSTCATYGIPDALPIAEEHPQRPINPYGASKLMVEQILRDYDRAYGIRSVSLRYFNAAGADPDGEIGECHEPEPHLIPRVLAAAAGREPFVAIHGTDYDTPDGTCVRDYIHVEDLADAHLTALEYLLAGGASDAFNLGNGTGFSVREVIRAVQEVTGSAVPVSESPRRSGDPPVLVGSAAKAGRVLNWQTRWRALPAIVATAWTRSRRWTRCAKAPDRAAA